MSIRGSGIFPINFSAMRTSSRRSLPEQIATRIHEQIGDGTYPPGSQLPLQKELAQHYGVSISVVRESLASLAASGLVWSRAGTGTFVSDDADAALRFPMWMSEPSSPAELAEALEARDLLARSAVALAAQRRDDADIARLRAALAQVEASSSDAEAYARADLDLHMAIAHAAHNRPLAGALAALRRAIPGVISLRAREAIADSSIDQVIDDYRQLVGALELGDERRSLRALDRMFARSRALACELGLYPDDRR
jgi:GntR family transcriptional regulator, transcriptional repressor for pyruvate dehydrogenase complex